MTNTQGKPRRLKPGRETIAGLIRRPGVLLMLGATAAAQVVMVEAKGVDAASSSLTETLPAISRPALVKMAPAAAQPDPVIQQAWLARALDREVSRLRSEHSRQGFEVSEELAMQIGHAAAEFKIDPDVAFGLVRAESSFRNQATSRVGAVGLTQLMPRTAAWIEPGTTRSELRDPETNLRVGFKYLRYLIDKYQGDEKLALLAYNRGPGTVDRALRRGRNPDNGYADFVYGKKNHGHRLFTR